MKILYETSKIIYEIQKMNFIYYFFAFLYNKLTYKIKVSILLLQKAGGDI